MCICFSYDFEKPYQVIKLFMNPYNMDVKYDAKCRYCWSQRLSRHLENDDVFMESCIKLNICNCR